MKPKSLSIEEQQHEIIDEFMVESDVYRFAQDPLVRASVLTHINALLDAHSVLQLDIKK